MEHNTDSKLQNRIAVFARLELTRLPPTYGYAHIDENNTSKLHLHAYNYSEALTKIAEETLTLYPAGSAGMGNRIHYLLSLTGQRVCVTYMNSDRKHIFELYEADRNKQRFILLKACVINVDKRGPTAIMAINDRCFLGFSNCSGFVDLTADEMHVEIFHKFESAGKAIDAFGYNGGKTLFAVDDEKWPKYAYYYDISGTPKKKGTTIKLPEGVNEMYQDCVKVHGEIAVRSYYSREGGSGNKLYVLGGLGTVQHSGILQCESSKKNIPNNPRYTSMGYLQDGVFLLVGNDEHEKQLDGCLHYLPKREMKGMDTKVRKLEIGEKCQDVVTVKDKQTGHVLATKKGKSILTEVKWHKENLEIVKELVISDQQFDRVYLEM